MPKPFVVKLRSSFPHQQWRGRRVEIIWPGWKHPLRLDIFAKTEYNFDKGSDVIRHYEVNWSALGTVPADQAVHYAKAILLAAAEADRLSKLYSGKEYK